MRTILNTATFIKTGEDGYTFKDGRRMTWDVGTAEATLHGKTRRVSANVYADGDLIASGFVGRYQTGGKLWSATVRVSKDHGESISFGRDDRCGRFHKVREVWFAEK